MSIINTRTGGAIAAAAAIGAAAIVLAGPATADEKLITEKYIASEECATVGAGQLCPATPANYWPTRTQFLARTPAIKVEFTANPNHCSDIIAHVFVSGPGYNGEEWGSNIVHPGQSDGGYEIPVHDAGLHQIGVQAEGIEGGCNIGFLDSWGGMLRIWQVT
jgi:hypothetical protein